MKKLILILALLATSFLVAQETLYTNYNYVYIGEEDRLENILDDKVVYETTLEISKDKSTFFIVMEEDKTFNVSKIVKNSFSYIEGGLQFYIFTTEQSIEKVEIFETYSRITMGGNYLILSE